MNEPGMKILLVDDSPMVLRVVAAQLRRESCVECVETASDGLQALEAMENFVPDVLVTDLEMPVMGGVECILALKRFSDPPPAVVMSSVEAGSSLARAALAAGAGGFVAKPRLGGSGEVQRAHRELMECLRKWAGEPRGKGDGSQAAEQGS